MARQFSAEHRANMRAARLGRKHDAATKAKISKTRRAREALIRRLLADHAANEAAA